MAAKRSQRSKLAPRTQKRLAEFGDYIRRTRRTEGISRAKLAEAIAMHLANYSKIEQGKKNLTFETMLRIADGLGLELSISLVKRKRSSTADR